MYKLLSAVCYGALCLLLGSMGFHASSSWQYWAVVLLVVAIDLLGGLTPRALDKSQRRLY